MVVNVPKVQKIRKTHYWQCAGGSFSLFSFSQSNSWVSLVFPLKMIIRVFFSLWHFFPHITVIHLNRWFHSHCIRIFCIVFMSEILVCILKFLYFLTVVIMGVVCTKNTGFLNFNIVRFRIIMQWKNDEICVRFTIGSVLFESYKKSP